MAMKSEADGPSLPPPTSLAPEHLAAFDAVLRGRRTVHEFEPDRVPPREQILAALELSTWAPNHHLTNPWRWYWLGRRTIEKVAALNARTVRETKGEELARKKLESWLRMPGWLVLTAPVSMDEPIRHQEDFAACAAAAQNLMLALWARGIATKWSSGPITRHPEFYELLAIDAQKEHVLGIFWYGYATQVHASRRDAPSAHVFERK
jgi:nitroreductase